jgi:hypothetical protein
LCTGVSQKTSYGILFFDMDCEYIKEIHFQVIIMCFQWKQNLANHRFRDVCKVETVVTCWLVTQDTDFPQQGIEMLVPQRDTRTTYSGDCEKVMGEQCG